MWNILRTITIMATASIAAWTVIVCIVLLVATANPVYLWVGFIAAAYLLLAAIIVYLWDESQ